MTREDRVPFLVRGSGRVLVDRIRSRSREPVGGVEVSKELMRREGMKTDLNEESDQFEIDLSIGSDCDSE